MLEAQIEAEIHTVIGAYYTEVEVMLLSQN